MANVTTSGNDQSSANKRHSTSKACDWPCYYRMFVLRCYPLSRMLPLHTPVVVIDTTTRLVGHVTVGRVSM